MEILVDSSVILDIRTEDEYWFAWSAEALADCAKSNILAVNPIIYAEVSIRFEKVEELDAALPATYFRRLPLPWGAAFLAGKCFLDYRRKGGPKRSPLKKVWSLLWGCFRCFWYWPLLLRLQKKRT